MDMYRRLSLSWSPTVSVSCVCVYAAAADERAAFLQLISRRADQVKLAIQLYLDALQEHEAAASPLLYYTWFRLHLLAGKTGVDKQRALSAVAALQSFPVFASKWLKADDLLAMQELERAGRKVCLSECLSMCPSVFLCEWGLERENVCECIVKRC